MSQAPEQEPAGHTPSTRNRAEFVQSIVKDRLQKTLASTAIGGGQTELYIPDCFEKEPIESD